MKTFEIEGIQSMSNEELTQTNGGFLGLLLGAAALGFAGLQAIYFVGYYQGRQDGLTEQCTN